MFAGLPRNVATVLTALIRRDSAVPRSCVRTWFRITPLDTGISKLKSDRYLQLAESAQLDFLIRKGLMGTMLKRRYAFVNGAQLIRFTRAIPVLARVAVDTRVLWADAKWAWFSHALSVGEVPCAEVIVKMKFKRGTLTVAPAELLGDFGDTQPEALRHWDAALAASR